MLPLLQRIHVDVQQEQALIIAPTRELIQQIAEEARHLGAILGVDVLPLIGGRTIEGQLQKLGRRPHVIIGTPGRLLDHVNRGTLHLNSIRRVVLDEADQMLHMGFLPDIEKLISGTNGKRQLLMFSAPSLTRFVIWQSLYAKPTSVTIQGEILPSIRLNKKYT